MSLNVVVVGGGAAGLMAAKYALDGGAKVTLIEKNEKLGKKIYITGKGRCNVTNACDREDFMKNLVRNPRFLYSALSVLDNIGTMELFEQLGVKLKTERGDRVFPESDHASDITNALERYLRNKGAKILLNTRMTELHMADGVIMGVRTSGGIIPADRVIIATGGLSYPSTGSDGDGHALLKDAGHSIYPCRPALVPIETTESWPAELMGLTLKNVTLTAYTEKNGKRKKIYSDMGEMLFTHFGVSGPLVLSLSSMLPDDYRGTQLEIDLKPALDETTLDNRILREFNAMPNKQLISCMDTLEPHALGEMILRLADISPYRPINSITAQERKAIVKLMKALPLTVKNLRGMAEAIITRGGINIKEIAPSTMESKLIPHLYAAGELLDIDALTGGFNLTIAFATGALAGKSAAEAE